MKPNTFILLIVLILTACLQTYLVFACITISTPQATTKTAATTSTPNGRDLIWNKNRSKMQIHIRFASLYKKKI